MLQVLQSSSAVFVYDKTIILFTGITLAVPQLSHSVASSVGTVSTSFFTTAQTGDTGGTQGINVHVEASQPLMPASMAADMEVNSLSDFDGALILVFKRSFSS